MTGVLHAQIMFARPVKKDISLWMVSVGSARHFKTDARSVITCTLVRHATV